MMSVAIQETGDANAHVRDLHSLLDRRIVYE